MLLVLSHIDDITNIFWSNSGDPREGWRARILRDEQPDRDPSSDVPSTVHCQAEDD